MKNKILVSLAAAMVLATAGCGTDVPSPDDLVDQAKSAAESAAAEAPREALDQLGDATADADGGGEGDANASICAPEGTAGMQALGLGVQLLAQPSLNTIVAVRNGEAGFADLYDVDAMREGIADYRALDGHPADGYDDPKVVLDKWEDLTTRLDAMINGASEPTQADIDAYKDAMGEPQDLIMSQLDLGLALDKYCG